MLVLTNIPSLKFLVLAEKFFYGILPYGFILFVRKIAVCMMRGVAGLRKFIKYGTADMFDDIDIETTTFCNRRCSYCPNSLFDRGLKENEKLMPEELFKKIIDQLKAANFRGRISPHLYGEPLLDKRLPLFMEYVHRKLPMSQIIIYTNADYLDIHMLNDLYDSGVKWYNITFHGELKEGVDRMRLLMEYVKKNKMKVYFYCQALNEFTPISSRAGLVKVKNIDSDQGCIYPLTINYKGDVLVCCNDYFGQAVFGNLEKESIMDIWNKNDFKKIRSELVKGIYSLDLCRKCVGYQGARQEFNRANSQGKSYEN